jgi:hypothetical protein
MCRKYHVRGETLTLEQILDRLNSKPKLAPKVVYSQQEIVSASKVLERLAKRKHGPPITRTFKVPIRYKV